MLRRVDFIPNETFQSFLSRASAVNGAGDFRSLARHMGVSYPALNRGDPVALERVSAQLAVSLENLDWMRRKQLGSNLVSLNGLTIDKRWFCEGLRYCPHCLLEDMDGRQVPVPARLYRRLAWTVADVDFCHHHDVRLVHAELLEKNADDFVQTVSSRWAKVEKEAQDGQPVMIGSADRYFARRLDGINSSSHYLDDLPHYAAVRLCMAVGGMLKPTLKKSLSRPVPAALVDVRQAGFDLLSRGEKALEDFLLDRAGRYWTTAAWHPVPSLFGALYGVVDHDRETFAKVAKLIRRIVGESLPVGPEDMAFGSAFERRFHTVATIAREFEVPRSVVRELLIRSKMITYDDRFTEDAKLVADVKPIREELKQESGLTSLRSLMTMFTLGDFTGTCIFDPAWQHALRRRKTLNRGNMFSPAEARNLLSLLCKNAERHHGQDMVSIPDAARLAMCSLNQVIELLAEGALAKVECKRTFASIRVSFLEVRQNVPPAIFRGLHFEDVACRLQIPVRLAEALMRKELLPVSRISHPGGLREYPLISEVDLEKFAAANVAVDALADAAGLRASDVQTRTMRAGIKPSIADKTGTALFYCRTDVED